MKIHIKNDYDGEWCQLWVNGELKHQGHSLREDWLLDLLGELGVEITEEECDLEE
jgi:hypothetical protein